MKRRYKSVYSIQYTVSRHGQSLLEVVVAIAIAAILAVSVVSTNLITQKTGKSAENNTRATKLVQQGIENIRIFRDRNPNGYAGLSISPAGSCFILNTSGAPKTWTLNLNTPCTPEVIDLGDKKFFRKITINPDPSGQLIVTVTVNWDESGGTQEVKNETYLSKGYN